MIVQKLIGKLSSLDPVQFMNGDVYWSYWKDLENFDEDDVEVTGYIVISDI